MLNVIILGMGRERWAGEDLMAVTVEKMRKGKARCKYQAKKKRGVDGWIGLFD